ncbi:MAG: UDP-galactopyranose mutase [Desulfovibrionaceae bacterium]|nr:UDP-galactopyranose mutase [Desulfovibrionaceae bacterium]
MQYFVIGAGIWGSVIAERIASQMNEKVLVVERRPHIGGNCHSSIDEKSGVECHRYGSHIFHTSLPEVWKYINQFTSFTNYHHTVLTKHAGRVYSLPINLHTINDFYGKSLSPDEAKAFIAQEIAKEGLGSEPKNLEEQAISRIGRPLYEAFIRDYTRKQWEREPTELPAAIMKRLPVRFSYNTDYFSDTWQGIPRDGYAQLFKKLLDHPNITVQTNTAYEDIRDTIPSDALVCYTGLPDALFGYSLGELTWRSLRFEWETHDVQDFQGTTVMNYADSDVAFTRIHEFKHYHPERAKVYASKATVICKEYPKTWQRGDEAYYPVNDERNTALYEAYTKLAAKNPNVILGGRLGAYRYWDMDKAIENALHVFETKIKR